MHPAARTVLLLGVVLAMVAMASVFWWGYAPTSRESEESAGAHEQNSVAPGRGAAEAAGFSNSSTAVALDRQLLPGSNPAVLPDSTRPPELTVTVRDGLGRPARGNLVGSGTEPGPWRDAVPLNTSSPLADGLGWLTLPAGLAVVHVQAWDCPRAVVTLGPEAFRTGRLDLQLRRACALRVRLVDAQGLLLAHRQIEAHLEVAVADAAVGGTIAYEDQLLGATDERGSCAWDRLVEGRWRVDVPEHCEWRAASRRGIEVHVGEDAEVEIAVPVLPAEQFAGLRVRTDRLPVAVSLRNGPPPEDEYEVEVTPQLRLPLSGAGRGMARCVVPGEPGAVVEVVLVHNGTFDLRSLPIRLVVGAETEVTPVWQQD